MGRAEWSQLGSGLHVHSEEPHCASQRVPSFSIFARSWAVAGIVRLTSVQIKNQDPISHEFQVFHQATKHLFHKIWRTKKSLGGDINACLCLNHCCQEKTESAWMKLTVVGLVCLFAAGRCSDFMCLCMETELHSQNPPAYFSCSSKCNTTHHSGKSRWASVYRPWDKSPCSCYGGAGVAPLAHTYMCLQVPTSCAHLSLWLLQGQVSDGT